MGNLSILFLRSFTAAVRCGNFTTAGKELGIGKSSVSQHIGKLEDLLGITLFTYSNRKKVLTSEGRDLYLHAFQIVELNDNAFKRLKK